MTGKRKLLLGSVTAAALVGIIVFVLPTLGCGGAAVDTAQAAPSAAALTVSVTQPQKALWQVEVRANGWLAAWQEVVVSAQVGGRRSKRSTLMWAKQ